MALASIGLVGGGGDDSTTAAAPSAPTTTFTTTCLLLCCRALRSCPPAPIVTRWKRWQSILLETVRLYQRFNLTLPRTRRLPLQLESRELELSVLLWCHYVSPALAHLQQALVPSCLLPLGSPIPRWMAYEAGAVGCLARLTMLVLQQQDLSTKKHDPLQKMVFGGIGGIMAGIITYPNDTVRRLLQIQGSRGTVNAVQFTGYWDCVRKTYHAEGIRRFYRGCAINIIRMAPNTAIQFGSYELLKQWSCDLV